MAEFDPEEAISLILAGIPPQAAIRSASRRPDASDEFHAKMVFDGEDLRGTPDPACVAEHLRNIKKPTREDIVAAFLRCSS